VSTIKILIVDDQIILLEGLATLLSLEEDMEVVGKAQNGREALGFIQGRVHDMPDVVLMDIRMPQMNGVECTKYVSENYPEIKVLILTTFDDDEYIEQAIKNGACGYMLKDLTAESLSAAIRNVYHGNSVMHQKITEKLLSNMGKDKKLQKVNVMLGESEFEAFTLRESEILMLLAEGLTNKEIADKLFLSEGTVKNYITLLYDKTGIKGRTKLMNYARNKC